MKTYLYTFVAASIFIAYITSTTKDGIQESAAKNLFEKRMQTALAQTNPGNRMEVLTVGDHIAASLKKVDNICYAGEYYLDRTQKEVELQSTSRETISDIDSQLAILCPSL